MVLLRVEAWSASQWIQLASLINQIASAVTLDKVRQETIFQYLTNGADSTFDAHEIENLAEIKLMAYMKLWAQLGITRAYFSWLILNSEDMERITKKDCEPLVLRPLPFDKLNVGYDEDGSIAGGNGLSILTKAQSPSARASMATAHRVTRVSDKGKAAASRPSNATTDAANVNV